MHLGLQVILYFSPKMGMTNRAFFQCCGITHKITKMVQHCLNFSEQWQQLSWFLATSMLPPTTFLKVNVHQSPGYTKPKLPQVHPRSSGLSVVVLFTFPPFFIFLYFCYSFFQYLLIRDTSLLEKIHVFFLFSLIRLYGELIRNGKVIIWYWHSHNILILSVLTWYWHCNSIGILII